MARKRKKPGPRYTPALDQVPITGQDRYIRRLQDLLMVCPESADIRERYYKALAHRGVPQETPGVPVLDETIRRAMGVAEHVAVIINKREQYVQIWARRIVRFLEWIGVEP